MKKALRHILNQCGFDIVRTKHSHGDHRAHLMNVFRARQIDCVIDVGANAGQYGEFLRASGFTGHLVSFEPVRAVFEVLQQKCEKDPKWTCHNLALGDKSDERVLNVYSSTVFASFLEANDYAKQIWRSLEDVTPERVKVVRLDDIYQEVIASLGVTSCLLKIDTQGFDDVVFRGAERMLPHVRALQSELSFIPIYKGGVSAYAMLTLFERAGYYISGMYPINRDPSLAVIEFDCVLVRRDGQETERSSSS